MAVTAVRETWFGQIGGKRWTGSVLGAAAVHRHYLRVHQVETSNSRDGPAVVTLARIGTAAVPQIGDPYIVSATERDLAALCVSVDPKRVGDSGYVWEVVSEFTTDLPSDDPPPGDVPPWDLPATEVLWGTRSKRVLRTKDYDARAYKASSGEHFGPQEVEEVKLTYRCTRAERPGADGWERRLEFRNTINLRPWHFLAEKKMRMVGINVAFKSFEGEKYPIITYEVEEDDWEPYEILDEGNYRLDTTLNEMKLLRDRRDGAPLGKKVLLDGGGQPLAPDAEPVFQRFRNYPRADWNELDLPLD